LFSTSTQNILKPDLRDESYATARNGKKATIVFIDEEEFHGAIRPTGTYTVEGEKIIIKLNLRRDNKTELSEIIEGTIDKIEKMAARIVAVS
jgi:hypothetical protein